MGADYSNEYPQGMFFMFSEKKKKNAHTSETLYFSEVMFRAYVYCEDPDQPEQCIHTDAEQFCSGLTDSVCTIQYTDRQQRF